MAEEVREQAGYLRVQRRYLAGYLEMAPRSEPVSIRFSASRTCSWWANKQDGWMD